MCLNFALHQEGKKKRDHFGTAAIGVHRMHHDSTSLSTRAPGLGWTSADLPHINGVHRNLRTNQVDPCSPLQKLAIYCYIHTDRCLFLSTSMRVKPINNSVRAQNKTERVIECVSPADSGIILSGKSPTCILHEGTPRGTRTRSIARSFRS